MVRWLMALTVVAACGDADGEASPDGAPAGCGVQGLYEIELGEGSGDCDEAVLRDILQPRPPLELGADQECGEVVLTYEFTVTDGGCSGATALRFELTEDGPVDGEFEVESNCREDRGPCSHTFAVDFGG